MSKKEEKPEKRENPAVTPVARDASQLKVVQQVNGVEQDITPKTEQSPSGEIQEAPGAEVADGKKKPGGKP